jgi:hypothetical protein
VWRGEREGEEDWQTVKKHILEEGSDGNVDSQVKMNINSITIPPKDQTKSLYVR